MVSHIHGLYMILSYTKHDLQSRSWWTRGHRQAKDWEALQQAVADAIVEADAWSDRRRHHVAMGQIWGSFTEKVSFLRFCFNDFRSKC